MMILTNSKYLCTQSIQHTWTPIKPVTVQFAVGKTKTARVIRKQFPLRPAAAKTIHLQGILKQK